MGLEFGRGCATLGRGLLTVYGRALRQNQPAVAEHVLRALEELVRVESMCRHALGLR